MVGEGGKGIVSWLCLSGLKSVDIFDMNKMKQVGMNSTSLRVLRESQVRQCRIQNHAAATDAKRGCTECKRKQGVARVLPPMHVFPGGNHAREALGNFDSSRKLGQLAASNRLYLAIDRRGCSSTVFSAGVSPYSVLKTHCPRALRQVDFQLPPVRQFPPQRRRQGWLSYPFKKL